MKKPTATMRSPPKRPTNTNTQSIPAKVTPDTKVKVTKAKVTLERRKKKHQRPDLQKKAAKKSGIAKWPQSGKGVDQQVEAKHNALKSRSAKGVLFGVTDVVGKPVVAETDAKVALLTQMSMLVDEQMRLQAYNESRARVNHSQQIEVSKVLERPKKEKGPTKEQLQQWQDCAIAAMKQNSNTDDCLSAYMVCSGIRGLTVWQSKFTMFFLCCSILECHPLQMVHGEGEAQQRTLPPKLLEENNWQVPRLPRMKAALLTSLECCHQIMLKHWDSRKEYICQNHKVLECEVVSLPTCPGFPILKEEMQFARRILWKIWVAFPGSSADDTSKACIEWMVHNLMDVKGTMELHKKVDAFVGHGLEQKMKLSGQSALTDYYDIVNPKPDSDSASPTEPKKKPKTKTKPKKKPKKKPKTKQSTLEFTKIETENSSNSSSKDSSTSGDTSGKDSNKEENKDSSRADGEDKDHGSSSSSSDDSDDSSSSSNDSDDSSSSDDSDDSSSSSRNDSDDSDDKDHGSSSSHSSSISSDDIDNGDDSDYKDDTDNQSDNNNKSESDNNNNESDSGDDKDNSDLDMSDSDKVDDKDVDIDNDVDDDEDGDIDSDKDGDIDSDVDSKEANDVVDGMASTLDGITTRDSVLGAYLAKWKAYCHRNRKDLEDDLLKLAVDAMQPGMTLEKIWRHHHHGAPGTTYDFATPLYQKKSSKSSDQKKSLDPKKESPDPKKQSSDESSDPKFSKPGADFIAMATDCLFIMQIVLITCDHNGLKPIRWQWDYWLLEAINGKKKSNPTDSHSNPTDSNPTDSNPTDSNLRLFAMLVCLQLSAATDDKSCIDATRNLFKKGLLSPPAMSQAPLEEIRACIAPAGIQHKRAVYLQSMAKAIMKDHNGIVPSDYHELNKFQGVGRKSIVLMLNEGFGFFFGIGTDSHVMRVTLAVGMVTVPDGMSATPMLVEESLRQWIPKSRFKDVNRICGGFGQLVVQDISNLNNSKHLTNMEVLVRSIGDRLHKPYEIQVAFFVISAVRAHYGKNKASS
jgi:endonuclease III